jgi:hypothetical protein
MRTCDSVYLINANMHPVRENGKCQWLGFSIIQHLRVHQRMEKNELVRRRTFGIISHPDAGKTTLTEKLLLFGGAIHTVVGLQLT